MIPHQIIEEIKFRSDITDVIGQYVTLKRAGSNMKGLCPFHNERTPSFTVYESTSSFYCFGCGAGGDVVSFVMRMENLGYVQALELLAKRAGIEIPEDSGRDEGGISRDRVLKMNLDAARFFRDRLNETPKALEYLSGRGYSQGLIRHFGMGYAPDGFGALTDYMHGLGYKDDELSAAFLCGVSRKTGRAFDYFRGRIIIPIIDTQKNVIAFGGRIMGDGQPKYLNTSDTPAFKKSRNLFALNYAKASCADEMILCEGYMDVIALHGAGFTNAVATLGTSITPEHARIMKRYTKKVLIAYDVDEAGQKAADKAFRLLDEVGLEARVIRVKDAKDPDEYIKKFGADRFRRDVIGGAASGFEFRSGNILRGFDLSDQAQRIEAAKQLTVVIAETYSDVERDIYTRSVAEKLQIPYESLKADVKSRMRRTAKKARGEESEKIRLTAQGYGAIGGERLRSLSASSTEEAVLGLMMRYPEYASLVRNKDVALTVNDMRTELGRKLFGMITESDGVFSPDSLNESLTQEEVSRAYRMISGREGLTNDESVFRDCVSRLKAAASPSDSGGSTLEDVSELINRKRMNTGASD